MANFRLIRNGVLSTLITPGKNAWENLPRRTVSLAGIVHESLRTQCRASDRRCGPSANRRANSLARLALLAFFAGFSPLVGPATAEIIIEEQFDYAAGSLNGQNGGQGFSAAWQATSNLQITSPGLTYGALETSGNAITGFHSGSMKRLFDNTGLTGDGATYWFSMLFAAPGANVGHAPVVPSFFSDATGPYAQASGFTVNFNPTSQTSLFMDVRIGGSILAETTIPGTDYYSSSQLVLGRITFSDTVSQDRLEVWLNPLLNDTPGTPLLNVTGNWVDPGINNSFYLNRYNDPDRSIDEIRLGTTIADVLPVPEPSTYALLLMTAAGALWMTRRRR